MPLARKARLRKICAVVFLVVAIGLAFQVGERPDALIGSHPELSGGDLDVEPRGPAAKTQPQGSIW